MENQLRVVDGCHRRKVRNCEVPQQRQRKSVQGLIERVQQQSLAVLIEQTIRIFGHVPKQFEDLDAVVAFSLVDKRNPLVELRLVEVRRDGGLEQEVDGERGNVEDLLEAAVAVPAYDGQRYAVLVLDLDLVLQPALKTVLR